MLSFNYQWHIIAWPFVSLDFSKLWQLTNIDRTMINIPVVWTLFCLTRQPMDDKLYFEYLDERVSLHYTFVFLFMTYVQVVCTRCFAQVVF